MALWTKEEKNFKVRRAKSLSLLHVGEGERKPGGQRKEGAGSCERRTREAPGGARATSSLPSDRKTVWLSWLDAPGGWHTAVRLVSRGCCDEVPQARRQTGTCVVSALGARSRKSRCQQAGSLVDQGREWSAPGPSPSSGLWGSWARGCLLTPRSLTSVFTCLPSACPSVSSSPFRIRVPVIWD